MEPRGRKVARWAVAGVMLVLPVVLLLSSVRSLRELEETKAVYLRNRTADLAARLETLDPEQLPADLLEWFAPEAPGLLSLKVFTSPDEGSGNPFLSSLWQGEALFHTSLDDTDAGEVFRAYIPFHLETGMHIAYIELDADSAEFLVEYTRRHLMLSLLASLALVAFTGYFLWSERRAVRFQRREMELQHLAHLGQMSAVLAHEIRNPLGTIKGFVQLTVEQAGEVAAGLLEPVLEEVKRLEKLVEDLLLYGRPRTPEKRTCSWPELAAKVEAHARDQIGGRTVRFVADGNLTEFSTDPDILEQVLLNLVRNSLEAVQGGEEAETRLSAESLPGGAIRIRVSDNGPGLPAEVSAKLFEPFTTTKSNGTGLGLSIVRKLTEALGGTVVIHSSAPKGTCAELRFPN